MKLEQYKENYDSAPYNLTEFAEGAIDIDDCRDIKKAAHDYLAAYQNFLIVLKRHNIEVG